MYFAAQDFIGPASSASGSSNGGAAQGSVNLNNEALSTYQNGAFVSSHNSQNSADGTSISVGSNLYSSANTGSVNYPQNNASVFGNSGSGNSGNAITGTLTNLGKSNTSSAGGVVSSNGLSQISGTGTGLSLNGNANAGANSQLPTTQSPYCCCGCCCGYGCCSSCSYCYTGPIYYAGSTTPGSANAGKHRAALDTGSSNYVRSKTQAKAAIYKSKR